MFGSLISLLNILIFQASVVAGGSEVDFESRIDRSIRSRFSSPDDRDCEILVWFKLAPNGRKLIQKCLVNCEYNQHLIDEYIEIRGMPHHRVPPERR